MEYTQKAIKLAIEGGWIQFEGKKCIDGYFTDCTIEEIIDRKEIVVIDPDFWRAIGKSEGWEDYFYSYFVNPGYHELGCKENGGCIGCPHWRSVETKDCIPSENLENNNFWRRHELENPEWKHHWHRLIDHLAEGNDVESYFKELLTHPKVEGGENGE